MSGAGVPTILGTNFARFSKRKLGFQEELASRVRTADGVPGSWKIVHTELEIWSLSSQGISINQFERDMGTRDAIFRSAHTKLEASELVLGSRRFLK